MLYIIIACYVLLGKLIDSSISPGFYEMDITNLLPKLELNIQWEIAYSNACSTEVIPVISLCFSSLSSWLFL